MHGRLLKIVQTMRYDGSVMKAVGYNSTNEHLKNDQDLIFLYDIALTVEIKAKLE